jgi:hypothetical protein
MSEFWKNLGKQNVEYGKSKEEEEKKKKPKFQKLQKTLATEKKEEIKKPSLWEQLGRK